MLKGKKVKAVDLYSASSR